ncbi:MAG TPA: hypothetical protein VMG12_38380 [Polyangiaceae bacterium]|nr:hypothetical protein [Polyangiaceae bacterium]
MHQRTIHSSTSALSRRILALAALSALGWGAGGCNGDALNLGEDDAVLDEVDDDGSCNVDPASVSVFAATQAEIDALSGCRELPGNLFINVSDADADSFTLQPLSKLEAVHGTLSIVGPLGSLAGLESVQRVAGLDLRYLRVRDLTALRGLTTVIREPNQARVGGLISLQECRQLSDLSGFENVTVWSTLSLSTMDELRTLDGLHVPPRAEAVDISAAPQLSDASALAPLEEIGSLILSGTAIPNLAGYQLRTAEYISLGQNRALTDLDGLSNLQVIGALDIEGNEALQRIELPALDDYDRITIIANAVLQTVPLYLASSGEYVAPSGGGGEVAFVRPSRQLFEVGHNPQLTSIMLSAAFTDVQHVAFYDNASLTSIDLANLYQADTLWVRDNPVLASVDAGALRRVVDLGVTNNPALSVSAFANVQTFTRDMAGNLDEPAP